MVEVRKPEPRNWVVTVVVWGGLAALVALAFIKAGM